MMNRVISITASGSQFSRFGTPIHLTVLSLGIPFDQHFDKKHS